MVFVLDCSGSMSGIPMEVSKEVMRRFITGMNPDDTFQVIRFSEAASALAPRPLPNTVDNQIAGLEYVENLRGQGGTMMIEGIKAALDMPADPERQRMVFFLTDGYIGNETEILDAIGERIGDTRIYSLGVGSSPNRYLIDEMAREGRGFSQYVGIEEDPGPAVDRFFRRANMPLLTSVEVDWNGLEAIDPMPRTVPDLFDRQPVFLVGRYRRPGEATVILRGRKGGGWSEIPVAVDLPEREIRNGSLRLLWARRKIADLMRLQYRREVPEVREEVLALALEHSLMSKYTSFVAVEHRIREDVALPLDTILIPSELPEGVDYEAVFGEATLSLDRIKPGDPVLAVRAPAETVAVLAEFPFGLRKRLVKNPETGLWICRFLVPRHVAEGRHAIRVRIVLPHGDWVATTAHFVVDATAPRFDLDWEIVGRVLRFRATPLGGVFDETAEGIQALVLPDVLSVLVRPPQGGYVALERNDTPAGPVWEGTYDLPAWYRPGRYTFRFLAMDVARNTCSREIPIQVSAPVEKEL
jgi:Ca-activated chloride channel family protein